MQPAESLVRKNATLGYRTHPVAWCSLPESEMRAVFVIVADVVSEQPFQMTFVQRNDVIQQISPAAFDPTLRHSVLPRTLERSSHRSDGHRPNRTHHLQAVLRVPVKDQESGTRSIRKRFPQLLDDPHARRMPGDVEVQNASTIMADDEEAIERAEGGRWDREEIHCGNGFSMIAQKSEPAFCQLGISRRSFHPAGDRSLRDIKTEHEELAMDTRSTPRRVFGEHLEDQISNLLRNSSPPCRFLNPGDPTPVETETCPMPANHGLWRDHDHSLFPGGPKTSGNEPEQLVEPLEPWPRMSTFQNDELLSEGKILEDEMPTTTKRARKRSEPERKQIEHGAGVIPESRPDTAASY
jgi:hypothetical protein